jgi:hypothetical protein
LLLVVPTLRGAAGRADPADGGLSYLQHTFVLSHKVVVARWVENPYWQYFCGYDYLRLALPIDPSSLVRWRQRIGQDGIELLLQETIAAAERGEAVKPQSRERISVDTIDRADGVERAGFHSHCPIPAERLQMPVDEVKGRPPRLAGGSSGAMKVNSASVSSLA